MSLASVRDDGVRIAPPSFEELEAIYELKYRTPTGFGWGPSMRRAFGYFNPDDHYEALVARLVTNATRWLDVGCGRELFPSNRALAKQSSERCELLVGIDPDATLDENPFVHERFRGFLQDYPGEGQFDLVTMRMVAEHVEHPEQVVAELSRLLVSGGLAVVYTVNSRSPVPLITRLAPFSFHHPVKRILWRTEQKDTFPTCFKMNTRKALTAFFTASGFTESLFVYLDDCRTFSRFRPLAYMEQVLRKCCSALGLRYPENCLLGVYRRR